MKSLIVLTQDSEWYGNDEGTEGRWKMKGGSEIQIATVTDEEAADKEFLCDLYQAAYPLIQRRGRYYNSDVIDMIVLDEHELTETEQNEFEYTGRIPARLKLNWSPVRSIVDQNIIVNIVALLTA